MSKAFPRQNYEAYRPSRNPYYGKLQAMQGEEAPTAFLDHACEAHKGKWREYFALEEAKKLQLEIGTYHGESLIQYAAENPQDMFLGIEWKYKHIHKSTEKAKKEALKNLCFLRANAARLPWMFAPGELDRVWILFPDPWPKKAQQKWRLLHSDFFRILAHLLDEGKEVMLKTDHHDYSLFIAESIKEVHAFEVLDDSESYPIWQAYPISPFENIFLSQGYPTFSFALRRNKLKVNLPDDVLSLLKK